MHSVIALAALLGSFLVSVDAGYLVCRCGKIPPLKYDIMTNFGPMCHTINTGQEVSNFVPPSPWNPDDDLGVGKWKMVNGHVESLDRAWLCDPGIKIDTPAPPPPPPTGQDEEIIVNVDNRFEFYYNGDKKLDDGADNQWIKPHKTTFPVDTTQPVVFAIKGMDTGGVGSILATGKGAVPFVTSPNGWKCSTQYDKDWAEVDFDDAKWSVATQFDNNMPNKATNKGGAPYIPDQSSSAGWIWTSDRSFHNTVYCRWTAYCLGKKEGDNCGKAGSGNVCVKNPAGSPVLYCGPRAVCNKGKPSTHSWGAPDMKQLDAVVNVDNSFTLYVNGDLMITDNGNPSWKVPHYGSVQLDANKPIVLAIEGIDQGGPGGMIASFSGLATISTDTLNWKCSTELQPGWNDVGFDDSCWKRAHGYGVNRNAPQPWNVNLAKQAQDATWIWTDDHRNNHRAYCRVEIPRSMYGQQQQLIVNGDNSFKFYYNGKLKLHDGGSGAWKQPQMTTFPIDTSSPPVWAVQGIDQGGAGGILMTAKGPAPFLSGTNWKCSTRFQTGWNLPGFDDTNWSSANGYGTNGGKNQWNYKVPEQDEDASWIWTDDNKLHNTVYCRFVDWCLGKTAGAACGPTNNQQCVANPNGPPSLMCGHPQQCNAPQDPTDWQANGGQYSYIFNPNSMNYNQAKMWCGEQGGKLASVHSADDNKFLMQISSGKSTTTNGWFGLMQYGGKQWMFTDGSPFDYGDKVGQAPWSGPDQPKKGSPCAAMDLRTGRWNSWSCSTKVPFFCQRITAANTQAVTATINVDNSFTFYHNGQQIVTDGNNPQWATPHTKQFNVDTNKEIVLALHVKDMGGAGGAIASFTGGIWALTKPSTWKCTDKKPADGWNKPGFDDSCWNRAHNYGYNRAAPKPWGKIAAQQPGAYWIWTNDHVNHNEAWCRHVVAGTERMSMETVFLNVDNTFNFYYNGKRKLTDNGNIQWKNTDKTTFPVDTTIPAVFAIQGIDKGGPGALIATGKGAVPFVTSPRSWKCSTRYQSGWNLPGFDDSNWSRAQSYGMNAGNPAPTWGKIPLQDDKAHWIWTADSNLHNNVYCRWVDYCFGKAKGQPCAAYAGAQCVDNPDGATPALICSHPDTCSAGAPSTKPTGPPNYKTITAKLNVDDSFKVYYNGQIIGTDSNWKKTGTYNFKVDLNTPIVFAVHGTDLQGAGGILASFIGPGLTLLSSTMWKCNTKEIPGWNNIGFDDSCWPRANAYGINSYNPKPWGRISTAEGGAAWIWTSDHVTHNHAYCRIQVPASALQPYETIYVNADNTFNLYYNGVRKLTDNGAIGWARTYMTRFPIDTSKPFVIAIQGIDKGGPGALLVTGTGPYNFVSTSDTFICDETKVQPSNWNALGFDDSNWSRATSYGQNGVKPWGTIGNGQSANAQWIWTDDHQLHDTVYCRMGNNCGGKSAGDKCGAKLGQVCQVNKATPGWPALICAAPTTGCGTRPQPTQSIGPPVMKPVTAKINGDNKFVFYYNGVTVLTSSMGWPSTHTKLFNVDVNKPVVLAIQGIDVGGPGGILGTFTGAVNTVTQPKDWKCTWKTPGAGWNDIGFDDSCWPAASQYGRNGAGPWGKRAQSASAYWIWSSNHNAHDTVWCRYDWIPTQKQT